MRFQFVGVLVLLLLVDLAVAQTCIIADITQTLPSSDFTDNGDGTVTHEVTELIWMQCSLGQTWDSGDCTGSSTTYNWANALSTAESTTFANHSDWRLPNIKELLSIVEYACYNPATNAAVFPDMLTASPNYGYWSSTPYVSYGAYARRLSFLDGAELMGDKNSSYSVRLVRDQ